jgi:hypothetical protein
MRDKLIAHPLHAFVEGGSIASGFLADQLITTQTLGNHSAGIHSGQK